MYFIIDNPSLIGFAEYLVWQQQGQVNGVILSDTSGTFPDSTKVVYRSQIDPNHSKVHLFFSDLSLPPPNTKINRRYLEQHQKRQFIIACRRALVRVQSGGHFVCKLSDTFTRFTAGLIYLLYRSFKSITIVRPFTVDPSSAERFLVCRDLRHPIDPTIVQHLDIALKEHEKNLNNVLEVVPFKCLLEPEFQQYLADVSQRLLQRETQALKKRLWYENQNFTPQV